MLERPICEICGKPLSTSSPHDSEDCFWGGLLGAGIMSILWTVAAIIDWGKVGNTPFTVFLLFGPIPWLIVSGLGYWGLKRWERKWCSHSGWAP